ncbi:unnamed protein product [Colias eurytheme]|nr:unnamed protein product [Colias eurytheme]
MVSKIIMTIVFAACMLHVLSMPVEEEGMDTPIVLINFDPEDAGTDNIPNIGNIPKKPEDLLIIFTNLYNKMKPSKP